MLKEILSGEATENVVSKIHDSLTLLGETVRSGAVPLEDFIIFKVSKSCHNGSCKPDDSSDSGRTRRTIQTKSPNRMSRWRCA